jgi:hypothetical protein
MDQVTLSEKVVRQLRIEFIYKPTSVKKRWWHRNSSSSLTQGIPYQFGFRVTNLKSESFPGASLSKAFVRSTTDAAFLSLENECALSALNPNESIDVWCDKGIIPFKGTASVDVLVTPLNAADVIKTFQYDEAHGQDCELNEKPNEWTSIVFIQGELELNQKKTNDLILWLTIITVLESVFGLKNMLLKVAEFLLVIVDALAYFLKWLITK